MPFFGDAAAMPPEVNWGSLMAGDHAASLTAAAAAHQGMAAMLGGEAGMLGANAATTAVSWEGGGGAGMSMNAGTQVGVMGLALAWFQQAAASLAGASQTYQTAFEGMIPGPVCDTNRVTQAGLVATNFLGVNTPAIVALDTEYFGHMWTTNAALMSMWQAAASAAIGELAIPPPINPVVANPAGPAAAVAAAAGQAGAQAGMQGATQGMTEAAGPASGLTEVMGPLMSQVGQVGQLGSQLPQMLGQLPQMAGQIPQMMTGMLGGSLMSPPAAAVEAPLAAGAVPVGASIGAGGGLGTGGLGTGGLGTGGVGMVPATYTRPSTGAPAAAPKMPTGWQTPPTPTPGTAAPMGGGMYGAPMGGQQQQDNTEKPAGRTVRVAPRRENT